MTARANAETSATIGIGSLQHLGETLRGAREKKGVNLEEAAARLRLAPRMIRSIEEGDFDQLPAATYARGYLRAYAGFLGLAAEPLLQAYERYAGKPPELNPFASAPPPQVQASDLPVRAVTYAVVAIVVGLLGAWLWQTQQSSSMEALSVPKWGGDSGTVAERPVTEPVQSVPVTPPAGSAGAVPQATGGPAPEVAAAPSPPATPAVVTPPPVPVAVEAGKTTENGVTADVAAPAADAAATAPGAVSATPSAEATATGPEATLAVNAPGMQVVPATGEIPYGAPATTANGGQSSDPTAIGVAVGPQALSFDLAEDSWIEVFDAASKRLYYNIGRQGTRVSVQGTLPYRVKVGNAPAVLVSYQGHSLDITAFSNGSVARFQVTPDGFLAQP